MNEGLGELMCRRHFFISEGGCPLWELVQFHIKKVYGKLAVKIPQFVFSVFGLWKPLWELSEIPTIVSAVIVDTLMDTEMFPVFDRL